MTAIDPARQRQQLYSLLGDLPPRHRPVSATTIRVEEREGYFLETLVLDLNGLEPVPAFFVKPQTGAAPFPTILYNHAHGGNYELGKTELLHSRPALQPTPYAVELTRAGYAALAIDHCCFGERRGRSEPDTFKLMLWQGQVLWGLMVYDSLRATDYLATRSDVDPRRLATLGLSMGSTMAWWHAALDERMKVCVDICCLTDFQALIETNHLSGHGIYYYVPGLLKHFSTADINALIAPRPHLALAGTCDPLTPPAGLDRIDRRLQEVYAAAGCPEAWCLERYPVAHLETAQMRQSVLLFLKKWL